MNLERKIGEEGIESLGRFYGTYYGVVINNQDPRNGMRLLVNVPDVYGYNGVVRIAMPNTGIMGDDYGMYGIPKKNAIVTITFRNGDKDYPIWSWGPYKDGKVPAEFSGEEIFGFKSRTGHIVSIDDENNTITIQHKDGYYLEMKEDQITVGNEERIVIKDKEIQAGNQKQGLESIAMGESLNEWLSDLISIVQAAKTVDGKALLADTIIQLEEHRATLSNHLAKFTT